MSLIYTRHEHPNLENLELIRLLQNSSIFYSLNLLAKNYVVGLGMADYDFDIKNFF